MMKIRVFCKIFLRIIENLADELKEYLKYAKFGR